MNLKKYMLSLMLSFFFIACNKLVSVNPPTTSLVSSSVYSNNTTAAAAVTGIYAQMMTSGNFIGAAASSQMSFSVIAGLSADELSLYPNPTSDILAQAYTNSLNSSPDPLPFWTTLYNLLYLSNSAIEGLSGNSLISPSERNQLLGEALFIRAFINFYLVNMYGKIPLILTTSYQTNESLSQSLVVDVYTQITRDLNSAQQYLPSGFSDQLGNSTLERIRPTKNAATALLARAYLYESKYDSAQFESTQVISDVTDFSLLSNLDSVFLMNSREAIWQLQPVYPNYNTADGATFILTQGPNSYNNPVFLSPQIKEGFEQGDARFVNWVGVDSSTGTKYYYPFKYKVQGGSSTSLTEYLMVLRLAEQYLIRAEAEAMQGNLQNAAVDLNVIRSRANLPNISDSIASSQTALLSAILHERQIELFTEWGQRWLDLKRTNTANQVLGSPGNVCQAKGGTWSSDWQLYPIPLTEIQSDVHLQQNNGY